MTNQMNDQTLAKFRQNIDEIDRVIIKNIAARIAIVEQIGVYKKQQGIAIQDPNREAKLYVKLNAFAQEYNVPLELITHIYDYIMNHSRGVQE